MPDNTTGPLGIILVLGVLAVGSLITAAVLAIQGKNPTTFLDMAKLAVALLVPSPLTKLRPPP